jgi:hypothetical protein
MYFIEREQISEAFTQCWTAACGHIKAQVQGPFHNWLRANLHQPLLEHLSFRIGNQLFFVRIEDVDGRLTVPGHRDGLLRVADRCAGHACILPMLKRGGDWTAHGAGWGLVDARSGAQIDPLASVTDELIEMTDWELHGFAVQVVRNHLTARGNEPQSWHDYPDIDPSIWLAGSTGPEWVVVRSARYPKLDATPPADWKRLAEQCAPFGTVGHFASVSFANPDDAFDPSGEIPAMPLWRGHGMSVRFKGLEPGPAQ